MELKERPVVSQLQVVRERIRAIRKILNQSEKLRKSKPEENYSSNNEQCEDDDETYSQAQKSLRELIETLNSGKEDKYTKGMINDYSDDDEYNEYSTNDYSQFEGKQKQRQLATISVQKAAFHYKTPKSHNAPTKKSSKRRNKKDFLNQNDYSYNDSNPADDSIVYNRANRIFGLNNKRKKDYKLDYNYNDADTSECSEYSSSYVYCPICSHKIHKRSKSPRECCHHQKNRKRNASTSRKHENRRFQILSESTTSNSNLYDNYSTYDDLISYDDIQYSSKQKQYEKRIVKNHSRDETTSSYNTDTSTLLNRYGSSPSISLYSSYNLELSASDVEDYSCIDDDDDIDVDEILRNLEKRKRYFTSMNDPYVNSLTKAWKTKDDRKPKRNQKENCVSSRNTISIKPRYKFEDSISSSCSVLSELLDEMSEEEKRYNLDNEIVHSSKRTKTKAKNQENDLNKRKRKQKSSVSSLSRNENAHKSNSEDEEEIKFNHGNKELDQILIKPITKKKDDVNDTKKVQHTVKFILEEEEEDIQNSKSNSSNNSTSDKNKPNSILMNGHEEEEELTEDVFLNSNIITNSKQKINVEEESLLELSSENSTEKIIYMQKFKQKQRDYSIEEEEEEISFEEEIHKFTTPVIKSKEEEEISFEETRKFTASVSKEEESLLETKSKSIHDSHHKKQATYSSLYNDVDDIDIFDDDEENHEKNNQVRSKNNQASEEESLLIEMHQPPVVEEEEEEDEIMMINHIKDDNGEESEEENMSVKHHSENENLSNIEEENLSNIEEENLSNIEEDNLSNDNIEFDIEN